MASSSPEKSFIPRTTLTQVSAAVSSGAVTMRSRRWGVARDASDTLRAILDEEPDHDEAAAMLLSIYDRGGRDIDEMLESNASNRTLQRRTVVGGHVDQHQAYS